MAEWYELHFYIKRMNSQFQKDLEIEHFRTQIEGLNVSNGSRYEIVDVRDNRVSSMDIRNGRERRRATVLDRQSIGFVGGGQGSTHLDVEVGHATHQVGQT